MMTVMCVCVWFCILKDMLVWLSVCSTIFCMIYLLTCKNEEEQADGGWLIRVSFDVICVCVISHILPITKAALVG
jgi:hypothetical protein